MAKQDIGKHEEVTQKDRAIPFCGIIMPISDSDGYDPGHWGQVRSIVSEAIRDANYEPRIVSDGNNSSIIHARIVTNIYQDEVVVCDVSSLNSNVMLEFGLRLASKKPLVVIKDSITKYSFDASPIEYVPYPTRLDYYGINNFKEKLTATIINAVAASKREDYKSFLEHFSIPHLELGTVSNTQVGLMEYLTTMENRLVNELKPKSNINASAVSSNLSDIEHRMRFYVGFSDDIEEFLNLYIENNFHTVKPGATIGGLPSDYFDKMIDATTKAFPKINWSDRGKIKLSLAGYWVRYRATH